MFIAIAGNEVAYLGYIQRYLASSPRKISREYGTNLGFKSYLGFKFGLASNSNSGLLPADAGTNNFAPSNVEGDAAANGTATTMFVDDSNIVQASVNAPISIESLFYKSSITSSEEDVKSFLAKPRILTSGFLNSTDVFSTFPSFLMPSTAITLPIVVNKLSGYFGFRATIVATIQINANRFQQGRYMLTFTSTAGSDPGSSAGLAWTTAHTNTLVQRTQLPRVELDLCCDTVAILKIPWVSVYNFYPLTNLTSGQTPNIGTLRLFPYSPLVAPTGSTNAAYTIWTHFEDIELIGPANPQMNSEREAKSQGVGPITSALVKTSKAINIWNDVPLLSAYTRPAAWFLDLASKSAAVFGWSKPTNQSPMTRMNRVPALHSGNTDTADTALPASLTVQNAVIPLSGFSGSDIDEMDFANFATIPAWFATTSWNTATVSGGPLLTKFVNPFDNVLTTTGTGGKVFTHYIPVQFVASLFNFWRGGLTFTFKFVKTEFHSGRLVIAFFPQTPGQTTGSNNLVQSDYVHREIVDIREKNVITLTVPYIAWTPYTPVTSGIQGSIGTIGIFVLDPLVAPSSVSSNVTILCEMSAASDFEVSYPSGTNTLIPVMNATPQSGSSQPEECTLVNKYIGTSSPTFDGYSNSGACVGERVSSFRTLLKSANWMSTTAAIASTTSLIYVPFSIGVYNNSATLPNPDLSGDLYAALASCFGLTRGGVRVRYALETSATTSSKPDYSLISNYPATVFTQMTLNPIGVNLPPINTPSSNIVLTDYLTNKAIEIAVPQYDYHHSRASCDQMVNNSFPLPIGGFGQASSPVSLQTTFSVSATKIRIARSGADDLNFGQFISIPPFTGVVALN